MSKVISLNDILLPKQKHCFNLLSDKTHNEILYGGGAGGGKSFLGCVWLVVMCNSYPNTRWLMGRSKLKSLKESTLMSFFDVCNMFGFKRDVHYKYNEQLGRITWFQSGSEIFLKDLFFYPSDKNFDGLGSTEYTGAFIDECNQLVKKAKDIVTSRIRYKLTEYNLIPKVLMSCNPAKNWVYNEFYMPNKNGTIEPYRAFIQALVTDNPKMPQTYVESLRRLPQASQERLLFGNWEFDDDKSTLIQYSAIKDMFSNEHVREGKDKTKYITADIAMQGSDRFVLFVWRGMEVIDFSVVNKCDAKEVEDLIKKYKNKHGVRMSNIIYDSDGLGNFLRGYMKGATPFNNGSAPKKVEGQKEDYKNLKAQCYFHMAKYINEGNMYVSCDLERFTCNQSGKTAKEMLIQELEYVKDDAYDKDGKRAIKSKQYVKDRIGRSPDFTDTLAMRIFATLKSNFKIYNY